METNKQKAIREAYGEYWEECSPNENGLAIDINTIEL